ncbi:hypothetical protein [Vallitalea okinawensis]|uniref:hypothetical protein n=1 Tax=Vallitalea okinawensis TaxID=2078660 RepID=UPI000CFACAD2|nr:hypothetical protein [Vallitalea okinawensis]
MELVNWVIIYIIVAIVISFSLTLLLKGLKKTSKVIQFIPTYISLPLLIYDLIYGLLYTTTESGMGYQAILIFALSLVIIICTNVLSVYLLNIKINRNKTNNKS